MRFTDHAEGHTPSRRDATRGLRKAQPWAPPVGTGLLFFDSWSGLGRVLVVGMLAYGALVVLLRISGNRTLSKLNAFDLVVTVALGSTLATIVLNKSVALVEGVLALALLVALQFVVTWCCVRWPSVGKLVKSEPVLLVHRGKLLHTALRRARVVEGEILAALRQQGVAEIESTHAVVLESDGSLSVLRGSDAGAPEFGSLRGVRPPSPARANPSNSSESHP